MPFSTRGSAMNEPKTEQELAREEAIRRQDDAEGALHRAASDRAERDGGLTSRVDERGAAERGAPGPPSAVQPSPVAEVTTATLTQRQLAWRRFKRHKLAIISTVILILIGLSALLAPL